MSSVNATPPVNERKMVAPGVNYNAARDTLDAVCLPDGEFPEGDISSVYFDTPDFRFLSEKNNGDNLKTKFRLRWYDGAANTSASIPAFLEIKTRFGSARAKFRKRIGISAEHVMNSVPGDGFFERVAEETWREWAREFSGDAAGAFPAPPSSLHAMLVISYNRRRHVCPFTQSRVALDSRIRAERINPDFFPDTAPVALPDIVCEFKNNTQSLPPWLHILDANGFRLRSFSKYGALCASAGKF